MEIRNAIAFVKKQVKELVGVEIGVATGDNAESILYNLPIKKLYLVDPYQIYEDYSAGTSFNPLKIAESIAFERLSKYKDKIIWIKKKSEKAVKDIPDNLDFVYIDGNHSYKYVKQDIENYYPKLKVGGILAGHDYWKGSVKKAVEEFVGGKGLKVYNEEYDWWVVKK